jgi:hypothetical protein
MPGLLLRKVGQNRHSSGKSARSGRLSSAEFGLFELGRGNRLPITAAVFAATKEWCETRTEDLADADAGRLRGERNLVAMAVALRQSLFGASRFDYPRPFRIVIARPDP